MQKNELTFPGLNVSIKEAQNVQLEFLLEFDRLCKKKIQKTADSLEVELYLVDILSYGVTLGLYSLDLLFVTFCLPPPRKIPMKNKNYGVPENWLAAIPVD